MKTPLTTLAVQTPDGTFVASYSDEGLAALAFPSAGKPAQAAAGVAPAPVRTWHRQTEEAVRAVLRHKEPRTLPPLDLSAGTEFQRSVWAALRRIPAGKTKAYREVALAIKRPKAVRAVGQACGANPIPLLIPCHRVLATGGGLGGFSGGLHWKKELLRREGHHV